MLEFRPPYMRSIHPPYRIRPRSAATLLLENDDEPTPGWIERLRRFAREILPPLAS